jgi:aspartyl-tRNA(Asn)/glutamyl-tRNA(Gln) amidotransferase subunit B
MDRSRTLVEIIQQTVDANPDVVTKYKSGKTAVAGSLIGDIMRTTQGPADPKLTHQLLTKVLNSK